MTDTSMNDMDTLESILTARHSCRAFQDSPVKRNVIERILLAAQRVPSWCNSQPWKLHIASGSAVKTLSDQLFEARRQGMEEPDMEFPETYKGEYKVRRSVCGWQLYDAVGIKKGDREGSMAQMMENYRFFGAPHVAIVTSPAELGPYGALDCGAFITGFTLAAQAMGVATIPQAAIAGRAPVVRDFFDIPQDRNILCAISFGYSDQNHPANQFRTERAGLNEFVSWT